MTSEFNTYIFFFKWSFRMSKFEQVIKKTSINIQIRINEKSGIGILIKSFRICHTVFRDFSHAYFTGTLYNPSTICIWQKKKVVVLLMGPLWEPLKINRIKNFFLFEKAHAGLPELPFLAGARAVFLVRLRLLLLLLLTGLKIFYF